MVKKIIKLQYEVVNSDGRIFTDDYNIKRMLQDVYEYYIKEQNCSDLQVDIITIDTDFIDTI